MELFGIWHGGAPAPSRVQAAASWLKAFADNWMVPVAETQSVPSEST
jgi:hypothetical protein